MGTVPCLLVLFFGQNCAKIIIKLSTFRDKRQNAPVKLRGKYGKHPHIRTYDLGVQDDQVLIYQVLSEKSA